MEAGLLAFKRSIRNAYGSRLLAFKSSTWNAYGIRLAPPKTELEYLWEQGLPAMRPSSTPLKSNQTHIASHNG